MELKWLEDFISLAETRSFSRSAELRHVTQPAFSRRIQSLEAWLGNELIDRSSYPTRLTPAGEVFYEQALAMLAQVSETRALMRGQRPASASTIDFAVPHTLSLTFFPGWLAKVEEKIGKLQCRLRALNVHDAVMTLVDGGCDLVMVYHHARQMIQLDPTRYDMLVLGTERLSPFSKPDVGGRPIYKLTPAARKPIAYLSYTPNAFLGRMVDVLLENSPVAPLLDKCYETDMAEALKVMALAGHGVAFLPESAVRDDVAAGRLVRAEGKGGGTLSIEMEIRLYREHPQSGALDRRHQQSKRKRELVDMLWAALSV
ncbi:LysR family transcriptional regulator [Ralstonia pseudosolanacearum]|uniref:LysR family transcriptional regulator n=1 Tax=Ralstonia solanacearum TaxID=305 RepID=A0A0S4TNT0_RALSL|nr:LysR family transcriptional regulator [Ralstonia pseudosolanacearum]OAI79199.1 LysR family transcriptional regulator [Ralstonia solanacearum]QCX50619.1 LysR family transcriptional regulator [Ralstonia pseudosolanacearum]CUV11723.1 putative TRANSCRIPTIONal REGULATOR, lysR family [Ralstonia solanacearum]